MERDGHYSFLTNNIFKNERNLFWKRVSFRKKRTMNDRNGSFSKLKKNIKKRFKIVSSKKKQ